MANLRITDLAAYTDAASTDVLPIVDIGNNTTKKISISDLVKAVPAGTAAAPGLAIDGNVTTGLFSPGADQLSITTGGTERLRVDAAGQIEAAGLGTAAAPAWSYVGDPNTGVFSPGADTWAVSTGGSERMRLTSDGRLGVGASSPQTLLQIGNTGGAGGQATHKGTVQISAAPASLAAEGGLEFKTSDFGSGYGWKIAGCVDGSANPLLIGYRDNSASWTSAVTVTNNGRVGIGTASPGAALDVSGNIRLSASNPNIEFNNGGGMVYGPSANTVAFATGGGPASPLERFRCDSSGRLLVGTSANTDNSLIQTFNNGVGITSFSADAFAYGNLIFTKSRGTTANSRTVVASGDELGGIYFQGADGANYRYAAAIRAEVDAAPGTNDMPGRIILSTTSDNASSPTERVRITSGGYFKASNDGTYQGVSDLSHELRQTGTARGVIASASNGSYADAVLTANVTRAANSAYNFLDCYSGNFGDLEVRLTGDGNGRCDGSWTGGGADYAEYFEWSDGNPNEDDRRGIAVVLDGDKIRPALAGEDPIGVISGNPSVVGDAAWNKWSGKYLRDEFGTYILEDYEVEDEDGNTVIQQRRKLNPAYDPEAEYTPREQRPEWDCVGLLGKLRLRKGQPTGSRWIKMRDISDNVEEWLVR